MRRVQTHISRHFAPLLMVGCLLVGLWGCAKDAIDYEGGYTGEDAATLSFDISRDPGLTSKSESADLSDLIYAVTIKNAASETVAYYADHTQMPESIQLTPGTYTISASTGSDVAACYDNPLFSTSQEVVLSAQSTNEVALECTLAVVKVSLDVEDGLTDSYSSMKLVLDNGEEGGVVTLSSLEGGYTSGYLRANGSISWELEVVNTNGTTYNFTQSISSVEARDHHIVSIVMAEDGSADQGGISPSITVDGTLNEQNHSMELVLSSVATPVFTTENISTEGTTLIAQQSQITYSATVTAAAGISDLLLTHSSDVLEAAGMPKSISLVSGDATQLATLRAAGVEWSDVSGATEATLEFGEFFSSIELGDYDLDITVIDALSRYVVFSTSWNVVPSTEVSLISTDVWAKFIDVEACWNTLEQPDGLGIAYKKASDESWTTVTGSDLVLEGGSSMNYSARLLNLEPETTYQIKPISTNETDVVAVSVTTEGASQLPYMNFDDWFTDDDTYYVGVNHSSRIWDSGNEGANTIGTYNPTTEETSIVVSGSAAKLDSKTVTVFKVFAAGSLYTGDYVSTEGTSGAKLDFGTPYTDRPLRLSGYYRYTSGTIDYSKSPYTSLDGTADIGQIYVVLADWDAPFTVNTSTSTFIDVEGDEQIIAYGSFETSTTISSYQSFSIDLAYRSDRTPKYVAIVATASKYGDYFTGSTGSVLYLDEFEFEFDPE